jgi:hypothetical protein
MGAEDASLTGLPPSRVDPPPYGGRPVRAAPNLRVVGPLSPRRGVEVAYP